MHDDICEYCDGSGHDPEGKGECPMCNVTGRHIPNKRNRRSSVSDVLVPNGNMREVEALPVPDSCTSKPYSSTNIIEKVE